MFKSFYIPQYSTRTKVFLLFTKEKTLLIYSQLEQFEKDLVKQKHRTERPMLLCVMGWMMGLEPTNAGTTNRCVNHFATPTIKFVILVRLERFEPPTTCLEGRCSIQLSYRRSSRITIVNPSYHFNRGRLGKSWSGQRDSNPRPPAPKAGALAKLRYAPIGDLISIAHL